MAGLRQDQLSGSEAARAARLLPSLRSPPLCYPPPPHSPGPHRLLSARPARRHHQGLPGSAPACQGLPTADSLSPGEGGGSGTSVPPPFPVPAGSVAPVPTVRACRVGKECDSKFQVHESPASGPRVVGISGVTWGAGEGVVHAYASRAPLASWRGALPARVSPPAVTRTRPRSRALTRALSHHTEHTRPRVLHPGAATRMCPRPRHSSSSALLPSVSLFHFLNFLFLPVRVAKCAKLRWPPGVYPGLFRGWRVGK